MADDTTLNISITADVSSLQAGMSAAATATQDFSDRASTALQAYNDISAQGAISQKILGEAFDKAVASGKNSNEAIEEAVAAFAGSGEVAEQAATKVDILSAAERQYAQATLEAVTARKALNEVLAANVGRTDTASVTNVAAAQQRAIGTVEQLALAKANLSEVQEYVATTAAQEADAIETSATATGEAAANVNSLGEAYAKLDAEILGVEATVLANFEGTAGDEAQVEEITDLSAAYNQLAEATLEAAGAKQALNDAITMYSGRSDEEAIAATAGAQRQATQATEQLAMAKKNLAEVEDFTASAANMEAAAISGDTSALLGNFEATEALTAAQTEGVSATMAAQSAMRAAGGSITGAARAAGAFLSELPGLGVALQAAFPIIGAAALLSILYQVGDAAYEAYEKASQAGEKINEAYSDASDKIQETTDQIELQNSKLQDEIDKLEGHPSNGLETALRQDIVEADKLQDALDGVLRKILAIDQNKNLQVTFTESFISNSAPSGGVAKETTGIVNQAQIDSQNAHNQYQEELNKAGTDQNQIVAATKAYHESIAKVVSDANEKLQPLLDKNVEMQRKAQEERSLLNTLLFPSVLAKPISNVLTQTDYSARINDIKTAQGLLKDIQGQMGAMEKQDPLEAKKNKLVGDREALEAANKRAEQLLKNLQTEFEKENTPGQQYVAQTESGPEKLTTIQKMNSGDAANYWKQYLSDFKEGSSEYKEVLAQVEKYETENSKEIEKDRKKALDAQKKDATEYQHILDGEAKGLAEFVKQQEKAAAAAEKVNAKALAGPVATQHQDNLSGINMQEGKVEQEQSLGAIDPTKALKELRALHDQEIEEDEQFIERELTIYAKEPDKVQELEKKLAEVHRRGLEEQLKDTTKILKQEQEEWKKVYSAITQDVNHAITEIITTTESPAQAFAKMFDQLLGQLSTFILQWLEKKAEMWVMEKVLDASGMATQAVTQKAANVVSITGDAGVAAAGTMAYYSAFDPPIAPAMAAAAFAETEAFAAFEAGGIVSGSHGMPVPIIAHAGERVLSAPQTQNFERMVNQPEKAGNTFNLNYNGQVNAFDRNGMRSTLKSHANDILDIVRDGYGRGMLK